MGVVKNGASDQLENLATLAAVEDRPAEPEAKQQGGPVGGEHLPADVEQLRQQKARERAMVLMGGLDWLLKQKDARLSVPESAYHEAGPRLAPLIIKHGLDEFGLPAWLQPYREEVSAAVFFFSLGAGIYMQSRTLAEADAREAAAQQQADAGSGAGVQVPTAGDNGLGAAA